MIFLICLFILIPSISFGMEEEYLQGDSSSSENENDYISYKEKTGGYILDLRSQKLHDDELTRLYTLTYSHPSSAEVTKLQDLNSLTIDLQNNALTKFPTDITRLTNLASLNLSNNDLGTVSYCDLGHLPSTSTFTSLFIEKNKLTELPVHIYLPSLQCLYAFKNRIEKLSMNISTMTSLTVLDINSNKLRKLPPEFGCLINLLKLNLKKNKLPSLPDEIGNLIRLTDLYTNKNRLDILPKSLSLITTLKLLDVSHNNLARKEFGFLGLTTLPANSLTTLNLSNNKLEEFPPVVSQLTSLSQLILSNNHLLELHCIIPVEIELCNGQKLTLKTYDSSHSLLKSMVYVLKSEQD